MYKEYPNLPLVEERFKNILSAKLKQAREESSDKWFRPEFDAEVFSQTFPNTAGLLEEGGTVSGQMITTYYITVMYEARTKIYGVFQGDKFVYMVENANDDFLEDIISHELATLRIARHRY